MKAEVARAQGAGEWYKSSSSGRQGLMGYDEDLDFLLSILGNR